MFTVTKQIPYIQNYTTKLYQFPLIISCVYCNYTDTVYRGYYISVHDRQCLRHDCLDYHISRARASEIS